MKFDLRIRKKFQEDFLKQSRRISWRNFDRNFQGTSKNNSTRHFLERTLEEVSKELVKKSWIFGNNPGLISGDIPDGHPGKILGKFV